MTRSCLVVVVALSKTAVMWIRFALDAKERSEDGARVDIHHSG